MNPLIDSLKNVKTDSIRKNSNIEELQELQLLLDSISEQVKTQLIELSKQEEQDDDEGFIEIMVDGKVDLIKKDIKELNVSCNNFKVLPDPIYKLKKLKKLYLYSNNFSDEEKKNIRKRFPKSVQLHF